MNNMFHILYIRQVYIKSKSMKWVGDVACIWDNGGA
jgi:hypothetical protein